MGKFFKFSESNLALDFLAGADPTGRATLELSKNNKKHHLAHRLAGDLGGFTAGSAATIALTAAAMYGGSKLIKKSPALKSILENAAKDTMIVLKPKKAYKALKNLPESYALVDTDLKHVTELRNLQAKYPEFTNSAQHLMENRVLNASDVKEITDNSTNLELQKKLEDLYTSIKEHEDKVKNFTNKTKSDHMQSTQQGIATVGGLAAAGVGGGLNAISAESQYYVGQEMRKNNKKFNRESNG